MHIINNEIPKYVIILNSYIGKETAFHVEIVDIIDTQYNFIQTPHWFFYNVTKLGN